MKPAEKLYFAYGSNMLSSRINERIGKVKRVGTHRLRGYRLSFNCGSNKGFGSVANLIKTGDMNDYVEGVVYSLTPKQLKTLDLYEGAPQFYNRVIEEYQARPMTMYVCFNEAYRSADGMRPEYFNILVQGCIENNLTHTQKILTNLSKEPGFIKKIPDNFVGG